MNLMRKITHSNFSSEARIVISVYRDFLHTLRVDIKADFLRIGYRRFRIFLFFTTRSSVLCLLYISALQEDYLFRSLFKFCPLQ
jgi:hypothetical protein